ncbi:MAG TPA: hypothetical protein QGI27_05785, partial [Flavobacteriaceae bacterium]|nr:hypothetical protein [Flavobacteriaceae bacterium]
MKVIKILFVLFTTTVIGQNYDAEFLDGTIMFKLNNFVEINQEDINKTFDNIGIIETIDDYPELIDVFEGISIISFQRPSYFTNKREL